MVVVPLKKPKSQFANATSFRKGHAKPPNAGRKKGTPNKTTVLLRQAILDAAEQVGFDGRGKEGLTGYLKMLAVKERAVYARLLEKVLPMQLHVEDKTVPTYSAPEAVAELERRGLPVPTSLRQLAQGAPRAMSSTVGYEDELNGIGVEGMEKEDVDNE